MATAPLLDATTNLASNNIAVIVAQNPALVLVDVGKRDDLYAHIRREVESFTPDLTTTKGRDAIKSLAFKITRTKTAIDAAGKQLNEEARAKIGVVDAARRDARETLDAMAEEVRRPLTEWEETEKARVDRCREIIDAFKSGAAVSLDDTAATVQARGMAIWQVELAEDEFRDLLPEAQAAKDAAVATLKTALGRLEKEEADQAELAKLRAEAAERDAREAAEREAREQQERAVEEARVAEERRVAAEKADAERIERARQEAVEAERQRAQREHDQALAAERARAEGAERDAQAERDRALQEATARKAAQEREAAEQAKREADKAHRTKIKRAAKEAIMTCGVPEEAAQKIVLAIIAGEVPAVTLRF